MTTNELSKTRRARWRALDVLLILGLSFIAQATHFSYKQGRAVISGDSAQYVASVEALLDSEKTPHFEMRKPGYILFLAGVSFLLGNLGWAAIVCNHALLALLPSIAYGLGLNLRGRATGWGAAILVIARLQGEFRADRIMSEALYVFLLSLALLFFAVALSNRNMRRWMIGAGVLMGLAWFTRSAATPIVGAGVLVILFLHRADLRRALSVVACFVVPVLAFGVVECSLNAVCAGQFRPSNGTAGATILLRARNFEGFDWPKTADAQQVVDLIEQRDRDDAYVVNLTDAWVARYHAVHELGMDEWEYDSLMRRAGLDMLRENAAAYLKSSARMTLLHLLRRPDGQSLSPIHVDRLAGPLMHPEATPSDEAEKYWFAHWGLPHMSLADSIALVDRMKLAAETRAPFGGEVAWKTMRYWKTKAVAASVLDGLTWLADLWFGFALLGFVWLGLRRPICLFLALAYLIDALFIGFLTPTTARLQFTWIVVDTTLAAALAVGGVEILVRMCSRLFGVDCPVVAAPTITSEPSLSARS